jgi:hypothetical protein
MSQQSRALDVRRASEPFNKPTQAVAGEASLALRGFGSTEETKSV